MNSIWGPIRPIKEIKPGDTHILADGPATPMSERLPLPQVRGPAVMVKCVDNENVTLVVMETKEIISISHDEYQERCGSNHFIIDEALMLYKPDEYRKMWQMGEDTRDTIGI